MRGRTETGRVARASVSLALEEEGNPCRRVDVEREGERTSIVS
jgi:hypothetical protein